MVIICISLLYLGGLLLFHNIFLGILLVLISLFLIYKNHLKKKYIFLIPLLIAIVFGFLSTHNWNRLTVNSWGIVIESKKNYYLVYSLFSKYYIYDDSHSYQVFDLVKIDGKINSLKFTTYESQFSFKEYLNTKGCYGSVDSKNVYTLFKIPIRYNWFINLLESKGYNDDTLSVLYRILFSRSYLKEWDNLLYRNNISYIFSLSSFHIYCVLRIFERIGKRKLNETQINKVESIFFLTMLFISNYKVSILKITIYKILYIITLKLNKKVIGIERILLTFSIICLIKPNYVGEESFILSLSLAVFLYYSMDGIKNVKKKYRPTVNALIIYAFLIPIFAEHTYIVSFVNVFIVMFFSPFTLILFVLGTIGLFIPLYVVLNPLCKFIYKIVSLLSENRFYLVIGKPTVIFYIVYYFILILIVFALEIKRKGIIKYYCLIELGVLIVSSLPINNYIFYEVDFINVGQGDSILIQKNNIIIMIDTGGKKNIDLTNDTLIPYLRKRKINHIDYLLITHEDYDHSGEKENLCNNFKVKRVMSYNDDISLSFTNLNIRNINNFASYNSDENDKSLVLYVEIYSKTFLFMGDASTKVEKDIIKNYPNLRCDYLKIGHHGSNTSSSIQFLDLVQPKEAIISVGEVNYYNHPSKEIVERLNSKGIKIRRTDLEGTISYKFTK